ncbi:MAG TPA: hypothetical protein VNA15_12850 [Candidatus Angelobacter sp.]|nr:hypothetical protein [Candidatus Angelobacter sp.]
MSVRVLEASKRTLEADIHILEQKLDTLKTLPLVRLNPDGVVFLSLLIHILHDCESQVKEAMAMSRGRRVYPLPVMRERLDAVDNALAHLEQLVMSLERSVDVPAELYFMLREVFNDFKCGARFVVLYYSELATIAIDRLLPLSSFPQSVRNKLDTFGIIFVPPRFVNNPEYWPRIVHETAHNIDRILGITEQSIRRFEEVLAHEVDEIRQSALSLCRERVADLLSTHYYGPAYGESALLVFLRGEPMALPTHPVGTSRLLTIASELATMGFHDASKSLSLKMRQLGIYEKLRDQLLLPFDVNKPMQNLLRKNARRLSSESGCIIHENDVRKGARAIEGQVEFDHSEQRFVRLTPVNIALRLLFNAYQFKFKGRFDNDVGESQDLQSWILDSIRLRAGVENPGFKHFYAR